MSNVATDAPGVHAHHAIHPAREQRDVLFAITMARPSCGSANSA